MGYWVVVSALFSGVAQADVVVTPPTGTANFTCPAGYNIIGSVPDNNYTPNGFCNGVLTVNSPLPAEHWIDFNSDLSGFSCSKGLTNKTTILCGKTCGNTFLSAQSSAIPPSGTQTLAALYQDRKTYLLVGKKMNNVFVGHHPTPDVTGTQQICPNGSILYPATILCKNQYETPVLTPTINPNSLTCNSGFTQPLSLFGSTIYTYYCIQLS